MSPAPETHERDPFALTANPTAYVPTPALERALAQLIAALDAGRVPLLSGPTGLGKTLLLQLVATRVRDRFVPLYVPYAKLVPRDLASLALGLLDRAAGKDAPAQLLEIARTLAGAGRPLLLLVDDAAALPHETAEALAAWLRDSQGTLRLGLAGLPGDALREATRPVEALVEQVHLNEGLPAAQVPAYVAARLESAGAEPSLRAVFDANALEALARISEGNPRRLHLAAQAIVRMARGEDPAVAARAGTAGRTGGAADPARGRAHADARASTPPASHELGEYRFVRGRFVDPRTGEPLAKAEEEVPKSEALHPPPREKSRPGDAGHTPTSGIPSDDLFAEPYYAEETPDLEASGEPTPHTPQESRVPRVARPPARRRWPGWLAAAVLGMAFGVGLSTQLGHLGPLLLGTEHGARTGRTPATPRPEATGAERGEAPQPPGIAPDDSPRVPGVAQDAAPLPSAGDVVPDAQGPQSGAQELPRWASPPRAAAQIVAAPSTAGGPASPSPATAAGAAAEGTASLPAPSVVVAPDAAVPSRDTQPAVDAVAVAINANPWAVIEIDGREVGETPLAGLALPVGRHRFVARMPDGTRRERVLHVDAEHRTVVFE